MALSALFLIQIAVAVLLLLLLFSWSVILGIIFSVLFILIIAIWNPALMLYGRIVKNEREVHHGKLPASPSAVIPVHPSRLGTPRALRLLEGAGFFPSGGSRVGALSYTFLSLNCRGIVGWQPLSSDGDVKIMLYQPHPTGLSSWEICMFRMLRRCAGKKGYFTLSEFGTYVERHLSSLLNFSVKFDRLITRSLVRKKYFICKKEGKKTYLCLSRKGAEEAVLWKGYFQYLRNEKQESDFYPDDMERFAKEAESLLCDAVAVGIYELIRDRLLSDYVFEPGRLWEKNRIFSRLHCEDNITPMEITRLFRCVIDYGDGRGNGGI